MAVRFLQQKKRQKYLILIFILIVLVTVSIWYFGFLKEKSPASTSAPSFILRDIEIDLELLGSQEMKKLQSFKEIILFKGKIGRENPFLPY